MVLEFAAGNHEAAFVEAHVPGHVFDGLVGKGLGDVVAFLHFAQLVPGFGHL